MNIMDKDFKDTLSYIYMNNILILVFFYIIYSLVFFSDMTFTLNTLNNVSLEGNPICKYFISLIGIPLNLIIPFIIISVSLMVDGIRNILKYNKYAFWLMFGVLLIFSVGHVRGIVSWL